MITTLKHRLNDMHIFTKLFLFCLAICFSIALISGVIVYNIASDIILDKNRYTGKGNGMADIGKL